VLSFRIILRHWIGHTKDDSCLGVMFIARVTLELLGLIRLNQGDRHADLHGCDKSQNNDFKIEVWKEAFKWGSASR
jgi:hypothetical protein